MYAVKNDSRHGVTSGTSQSTDAKMKQIVKLGILDKMKVSTF